MVNWLLLLAVGGLVSPVTAVLICHRGLSSWTFDDFNTCTGPTIEVDGGHGNIDLSTWTDDQLKKIFNEKEFIGGFNISNSQIITGKNIYFTVGDTKENARIVIENNPILEELSLERTSKSPLYIRVSGNRQLKKKYITMLNDLKTNQEIRDDSHIQAYHECDLNGDTIKNVKSDLANCNAVYGNLVFDANTVFPQDENEWNSIAPLEYIKGCIRITGTTLKSWDDITFLQKTRALKGCATSHELSGNQNMCIQPPTAQKLKDAFEGLIISGNKKCTPECSSNYLHQKPKTTCVIITDSLIINEKTTDEVLKALKNVEEIHGNLQIANTNLKDFNYLPKLQKLNTNKMDSGPVIHLQRNSQLKSFDLPLLNASGLLVERTDQLRYHSENNGQLNNDPNFLKRIGANDSNSLHMTPPPTTPGTTTTQLAIVERETLAPALDKFRLYGIIIGSIVLIVFVVTVLLIYGCCCAMWCRWPKEWEWNYMNDNVDWANICKYEMENEWHKKAKQLIETSKKKIDEFDKEHENANYTKLTFSNHVSRRVMPGLFQMTDYETRKGKDNTLDYPAGKDGVYGLAFQEQFGKADTTKYRTQCDKYGFTWFKSGLHPIYPESFETTAKLMAELPCAMIGDKIDFMTDKKIPIGKFGITGQEFNAAVTKDDNDPVASRAKREEKDVFWLGDQIPEFKIHRYCEILNNLDMGGLVKYTYWPPCPNEDGFVCRLVKALMNLPTAANLELTVTNVKYFLHVTHSDLFEKNEKKKSKKKPPQVTMSDVKYMASLNKTHVRIVGEIRGDFDALRRAVNIPSLLGGKEHPLLQYNWVFLGNYTGRHPQSLETLMFLLALQFLYGRDCIVLLRGVMEFTNISENNGFKDNLIDRFGKEGGLVVWEWMMKAVSQLPLNCQVLYGAYCSSGGFTEADVGGQETEEPGGNETTTTRGGAGKDKKEKKDKNSKNAAPIEYRESTTPRVLDKLFSLPNVTVRDYLENADTGVGYYYGERVLEKIARETDMCTFFSTMPMICGVGFFSDSSVAQLITISSVRNLEGHGGQKTLLAAVAEINGDTNTITMHMILHEKEIFNYDEKTGNFEDKQDMMRGTARANSTTRVTPSTPTKNDKPEKSLVGYTRKAEAMMKKYQQDILKQTERTLRDEWVKLQGIKMDGLTEMEKVSESLEPTVPCFESTRVKANEKTFHHASWFTMPGVDKVVDPSFILAQAPKEGRFGDFWKTIFVADPGMMFIFMPIDKKDLFFPFNITETEKPKIYGDMKVECKKKDEEKHGTWYTLEIMPEEHSNALRCKVFHYEHWEAGKMPAIEDIFGMIEFCRKDSETLTSKIACVSRKGTGRSCVFAAALLSYNRLFQGHYSPVLDIVAQLKKQRAGAIENLAQYSLIHWPIAYYIHKRIDLPGWIEAQRHARDLCRQLSQKEEKLQGKKNSAKKN